MSVFRQGSSALITGGASGIGLAVAQHCLSCSMRVTVVDNNQATLDLAQQRLKGDVRCVRADVGDASAWDSLREKTGEVDFLMLNAGRMVKGTWGDNAYFQQVLDTNLYGVINGLNTYVPDFQKRGEAEGEGERPRAIVVTGSKQGITNPPGNAAYNASKAAVKALAEHLSFDLKDTKTSVHLLVPGWTFTGMSGNVPGQEAEKPEGAWSPEQVKDYMVRKMGEGKFYILCPDNDVSEETDKKRMLWSVGDVVNGRPPLTRWRPEFKEEAEEWMAKQEV
ncbi:hypothetical protein G6514_002223 [Epicoccum nigrum]|nr:hypothetical protein G6514_002223 [Epicoccum nigrum]